MKTVNLNRDVLNDGDSIYFQKNTFELIGVTRKSKEGIIDFLHRIKSEIEDNGYQPNIIFMSIVIYSEVQYFMNNNALTKDLLITVDKYILDLLNISSDFVVYIPDSLKDQCRTV